ncbi:MAG: TonB family protein [Cyanobacteria bacterium J06635_15]
MALSNDCLRQHYRENTLTQRWTLLGMLGATGLHLGLLPLIGWVPAQLSDQSETDTIQIVVTPTEAEPAPSELAETSTEAGSDSAELASQPPPLQVPERAELSATANLAPEPEVEAEPEELEAETEPETVEDPEAETEPEVVDETTESEETAEVPEPDSETDESPESSETAVDEAEAGGEDVLAQARDTLGQLFTNGLSFGQDDGLSEASSEGDAENVPDADGPVARAGSGSNTTGNGGSSTGNPGNGNGSGGGSRTIACVNCPAPSYPESARQAGIEGEPRVSIQFDANGNVVGVTLERSSGNPDLDQAAMSAARNYQFGTGGQGGSVSLEMPFVLEGSDRQRQVESQGDRREVSVPDAGTTADNEAGNEPEDSDVESAAQDIPDDAAADSTPDPTETTSGDSEESSDEDARTEPSSEEAPETEAESNPFSPAPAESPPAVTNELDSAPEPAASSPQPDPTPVPAASPEPAPAAPPPVAAPNPAPAAPPPVPAAPPPEAAPPPSAESGESE